MVVSSPTRDIVYTRLRNSTRMAELHSSNISNTVVKSTHACPQQPCHSSSTEVTKTPMPKINRGVTRRH